MGAHLCRLAFDYMPHELSRGARVVLLRMCLTAKDSGEQPALYFGGWRFLADGLGYTAYNDAARRNVGHAMRELTEQKLVVLVARSGRGTTCYRVLPYVVGEPPTDVWAGRPR
jgi:hypothetical protein